jgi:hypothetical protein
LIAVTIPRLLALLSSTPHAASPGRQAKGIATHFADERSVWLAGRRRLPFSASARARPEKSSTILPVYWASGYF